MDTELIAIADEDDEVPVIGESSFDFRRGDFVTKREADVMIVVLMSNERCTQGVDEMAAAFGCAALVAEPEPEGNGGV